MLIPAVEYGYIKEHLPIACVDLLIIHEGKCLLLLRDNEPAKGQYWFPGGRILKNELIEHAAIRKAKEETGLDCLFEKVISVEESLFKKIGNMESDVHTINICSLVTTKDLEFLKIDSSHSGFKWIDKLSEKYHHAVINPLLKLGFRY
ncbi:MAG TPA: NUDIX domain-containing protein [Puia sp.]|nr:NUDIX domain-containing protein [Puia sp.]